VVSRFNFGKEAFWFFGDSDKAGIPRGNKQMRAWVDKGLVLRWFYSTDKSDVPFLPDEIIHFRNWNPWNEIQGVLG